MKNPWNSHSLRLTLKLKSKKKDNHLHRLKVSTVGVVIVMGILDADHHMDIILSIILKCALAIVVAI